MGVGMGVGLAGGSLRHNLPTCWILSMVETCVPEAPIVILLMTSEALLAHLHASISYLIHIRASKT